MTATMTKGEREDLLRLIKNRERTQKSAATQRSAELLAEFETQIASRYSFDQESVWADAFAACTAEQKRANDAVAQRCRELGIPAQFAPRIVMNWYGCGENASANRRAELRRVAKSHIEAAEKQARIAIEMTSIEAQTKVLAAGLTSAAAISFLDSMPKLETLMPALNFNVVERLTYKPGKNPVWEEEDSAKVVPLRLVEQCSERTNDCDQEEGA